MVYFVKMGGSGKVREGKKSSEFSINSNFIIIRKNCIFFSPSQSGVARVDKTDQGIKTKRNFMGTACRLIIPCYLSTNYQTIIIMT